MIVELLKHQWKSFVRSASFEREIAIKVLLGFFVLYMIANMAFLAYALPTILQNNTNDPVIALHKILFFYYVTELFLRYFIQSSPAINLESYLHLPINKRNVSLYLQVKSLFHPINFLAALLTGPFAFKVIAPAYGEATAILWWVSIILLSVGMHFLMLIFRKKWEDNFITWLIIIAVAAITYFLELYGIFNPSALLGSFFNELLDYPVLVLAPLFLAAGLAYYSYLYFKNNLYLEDLVTVKKVTGELYTANLSFLDTYGLSGNLMLQEIKLIIRHKKSRTFLIMSVFLLFYGLIFLDDYKGGFNFILIFLGIFISGIFMMNYGQLLWSWKTNLLDFYFTRPFPLVDLVTGLHRLLLAACILYGILTIPYVYFGWEVLVAFMSCTIYNMGVNVPLVMRLSLWKPAAMDINKTAFMNYEGVGPAQWLMVIPVLGIPVLIYFGIASFTADVYGIAGIALCGIIGLIFQRKIIETLAAKLQKDKYILVKNLTL